ncbi:MAG: trypsin-like serine protease [Sphingomonadaceae bacterium]|uniref:PEPxxWA-CTERM sorting domain-containing protein n=1 Tax=Thermaurantiacus sp. TaxID=2820283 RepID=UPI00298ED2FF|nr:PEPxxWA-CTERM sorting domain-containing protein [Thermaurantiacus sp.]MCS6987301.1 trypsin-like serine protease [Sphingomonadaceae bacterium]MDW8414521.1 trypsin-like serine protease [Thermaurantiacus sp.]
MIDRALWLVSALLTAGAVQAGGLQGPISNEVAREIVGQTSTATVAAGGNPIYIPPKPQYSGVVGLRMDFGAAGAFVCSGSLLNRRSVLTAAHCVTNGGQKPLSTTVHFYGGPFDLDVYSAASAALVTKITVGFHHVHPLYTEEVVDENDIAVLKLTADAPAFAPRYALSGLTDLTGVAHEIAGYGLRSLSGGANGTLPGFALAPGRLRSADNRFDFRLGDPDFGGFFAGFFGTAPFANVWITDFDNNTPGFDASCVLGSLLGLGGPKYCHVGVGPREGIGAGGDSGAPYFVDGKVAAVHSFGWAAFGGTSANRFGMFKGAVPVYLHRDYILAHIPEPSTWALMIAGFGLVGGRLRRRRLTAA